MVVLDSRYYTSYIMLSSILIYHNLTIAALKQAQTLYSVIKGNITHIRHIKAFIEMF